MKDVRVLDDLRSHWVIEGPWGQLAEFESQIEQDVPDRRLAWHSLGYADVQNRGTVQFDPVDDDRAKLTIHLLYRPPGGLIRQVVAHLFARSPYRLLSEDLAQFKERMESGPARMHAP